MSSELTHREKYVLGEIISLTKKDGSCWATNTYFEEKFNIPKRSIIRILNKLEKMGLIQRIIIKEDGTFRRIFLGEKLGGCANPVNNVGTRGGDKSSTGLAHGGDKPIGKVGTPKDKQFNFNIYTTDEFDSSGQKEKKSFRETKYPVEWYDQVLKEYCELKNLAPKGNEWNLLKREVKLMFQNGRTPEEIIKAMRRMAYIAEKHKLSWKLGTIRVRMPELLAGR